MDDRELETRLKALNVPPPRPELIEKAFDLSCQDFNTAQKSTKTNRRRRPIAAALGLLGIAAAVSFVVSVSKDASTSKVIQVQEPQTRLLSAKDWRRVIAETQILFPGRLKAVVATESELDIQLHLEQQRISDQIIVVALQAQDGAAVELFSFSGEVVETEIGDSHVRLELMLTASDDVLLTGDNFFWTIRDSKGLDAFAIRAWPLENGA